MDDFRPIAHVQNELGEGVLWDPDEQVLYWLDILGRTVFRYDPVEDTHQRYDVGTRFTVLGLREHGGFVVGTADGLAYWDPERLQLNPIADPTASQPQVRFNDGAVDPLGNFWAGTMNEVDEKRAEGVLYRLDPDGTIREMGTGFTVSNGIGWSPDGETMYFTDTQRRSILAFDFDLETGLIDNRRVFVEVPPDRGFPDGLTVDGEGFVWSAGWGGWCLTRYAPTGEVERQVRLPVSNVTSCAFGGADLDELYITSARVTLSDDDLAAQPLAGDLFRLKTGVQGQKEYRFKG